MHINKNLRIFFLFYEHSPLIVKVVNGLLSVQIFLVSSWPNKKSFMYFLKNKKFKKIAGNSVSKETDNF